MAETLAGKVVVVTGAGRGLGRAHALELARHGARVVVNDVGADVHGAGSDLTPAAEVVARIGEAGGTAVLDNHDVSVPGAGDGIVEAALSAFGRLDAVVNNAGILRDRMLVNLERDDWSAVLAVHLTGTYEVTRAAARHWRELAKQGHALDARVVCTTSASGLYGNAGQANYAAAKAGVVGFVITVAKELSRYGISVNALSPGALTRMTDGLFGLQHEPASRPENVAPAVAWLLGPEARGLSGAVLECEHGWAGFARPWAHGERAHAPSQTWTLESLTQALRPLTAARSAEPA